MTTTQTLIVGTALVLLSLTGFLALIVRELMDAARRWEAEREAAACAAWEAHVEQALAAASPVPDYVPDEWE